MAAFFVGFFYSFLFFLSYIQHKIIKGGHTIMFGTIISLSGSGFLSFSNDYQGARKEEI